jgi:hypothetical protein
MHARNVAGFAVDANERMRVTRRLMKRSRWLGMALFIGVAACEHKDAPAAGVTAPATSATATAATATAADTSGDGGATVTSKPAAARDAGAAGATDAAVAADARMQLRPAAVRVQRALRGTRQPGLMPHGSLDRGTLIYRAPLSPPPLMSTPPTSPTQKQ